MSKLNNESFYDNDERILKPGQIEEGMFVTIHNSQYDKSWIGDVFKVEHVEGPYVICSFEAQWRGGSFGNWPHLFDLRTYTFRVVSEEYIKFVKNLRQTPAVPAFKPASATIEEEQFDNKIFDDEPHICCGEGFGEC